MQYVRDCKWSDGEAGLNVVDHGHVTLELEIVMACSEVHQRTQTLAPERCLTVAVEDGREGTTNSVLFALGLVGPTSPCDRLQQHSEACPARPSLRRQHRAEKWRLRRILSVQWRGLVR